MKINGPGAVSRAAIRSSRKTGSGGGGFKTHLAENLEPGVSPVAGAASIAPVDALLAIQEVSDATARRKEGEKRGRRILDSLDEVRLGLLEGTLPRDVLRRLLREVEQDRHAVNDPGLSQILDEIDLRARVELAKHGESD